MFISNIIVLTYQTLCSNYMWSQTVLYTALDFPGIPPPPHTHTHFTLHKHKNTQVHTGTLTPTQISTNKQSHTWALIHQYHKTHIILFMALWYSLVYTLWNEQTRMAVIIGNCMTFDRILHTLMWYSALINSALKFYSFSDRLTSVASHESFVTNAWYALLSVCPPPQHTVLF